MNILITGGNGFIGSNLAERLLNRGDSVTLFDLQFTTNTLKVNCEKIIGDVKDYASIAKAMIDKDVVFHFAAVSRVAWGEQDPLLCWQTNLMGTINVLEACRTLDPTPQMFYASSREVYGDPQYFPVDESHPKQPKSLYGLSKQAAEQACLSYFDMYGLPVVIFRFSNVYGGIRDLPERVIPKFMHQALANTDIQLYGGEQILDFTFIDDTVNGIMATYSHVCEKGQDALGEAFHFVTGRGVSVSQLAHMIVDEVTSASNILTIAPKRFDVHKFIGDPAKAYRTIGYRPTTQLEDGLRVLKEKMLRES